MRQRRSPISNGVPDSNGLRHLSTVRKLLASSEREARSLKTENSNLRKTIREKVRIEDEVWFTHDNKLMFSHRCLGEKREWPLDGWHIWRDGRISPSIKCDMCGAHFTAKIMVRLNHYEETFWGQPWKAPKTLSTREESNEPKDRHPESNHAAGDTDVRVERREG